MTATTCIVRFGADGAAKVQSYVRLTGSTYIHCCTYDDAAPILTIRGRARRTSRSPTPTRGEVTEEDVTWGRLLAEAVNPVRGRAGEARRREPRRSKRPDEPGGQAA